MFALHCTLRKISPSCCFHNRLTFFHETKKIFCRMLLNCIILTYTHIVMVLFCIVLLSLCFVLPVLVCLCSLLLLIDIVSQYVPDCLYISFTCVSFSSLCLPVYKQSCLLCSVVRVFNVIMVVMLILIFMISCVFLVLIYD